MTAPFTTTVVHEGVLSLRIATDDERHMDPQWSQRLVAALDAVGRDAAVRVLVLEGDWTNGDPAITRFLEARGRAGVPLYLWYAPGKPPEELPQVLTPSMLTGRAQAVQR